MMGPAAPRQAESGAAREVRVTYVAEPGGRRPGHGVRLRRLGIDTYREPVVFLRGDSHVVRSEGFEARARVEVTLDGRALVATLHVVEGGLLRPGDAGLSEAAWRTLGAREGEIALVSHPAPLASMSDVRTKIFGRPLADAAIRRIVRDVADDRFSDVELAAFVTACAGDRLSADEIVSLTRAMVDVGHRLTWPRIPVVDKHCVGGLPGNRTTPIVVAIVASLGLCMPKTSSRAITSPAGTADAMETLAPVDLGLDQIRRVVEREGACIVWGGSVQLSPADDVLIRVERALDLDAEGQLVASVLSKKVAAGATDVVLDLPVGPTAKVRDDASAARLSALFCHVANVLGVRLRPVVTDGRQPVGRGVGPALEARDVLAVLRNEPGAPPDLRDRALDLAGHVVEMGGAAEAGRGREVAAGVLASGRAATKFHAICEAQGGAREPPSAPYRFPVAAPRSGVVASIDCRKLARVAKLAGAPRARSAGVLVHARLGDRVERGSPLLTIHAETPGELDYALEYVSRSDGTMRVEESA
jgi:thymidine phosphorylase